MFKPNVMYVYMEPLGLIQSQVTSHKLHSVDGRMDERGVCGDGERGGLVGDGGKNWERRGDCNKKETKKNYTQLLS